MPDPEKGATEQGSDADSTGATVTSPPDVKVVEDDPAHKIKGLQEGIAAERTKRQELEAKLAELQAAQELPDIDWTALGVTEEEQPPQQQPPVQQQQVPDQQMSVFMEQFHEAINSGDPARQFQAVMAASAMYNEYQKALEAQARQVIPVYDNLPVQTVPPEVVAQFQQNPALLRAVIAMAKTQMQQQQKPPEAQQQPQTPLEKLQQEWLEKGRQEERERIAKLGQAAGMTGEGSGTGPSTAAAEEKFELDPLSTQFLKSLGHSDEEIAARAKAVAERQRSDDLRRWMEGGV